VLLNLILPHSTPFAVECQDLFQKKLKFFSKNVDFRSSLCYDIYTGGEYMEHLISIGLRIRALRQAKRLTQEELAYRAGYTSRSSINKIEKGIVDLQRSKIIELANALGVSPSYILFGNEEDDKIEEEKQTAPTKPELSEGKRKLIEFAESVPEDKIDLVLRVMQSIVEAD
jgi:transcriptional regulator with XRE-family HTH domain